MLMGLYTLKGHGDGNYITASTQYNEKIVKCHSENLSRKTFGSVAAMINLSTFTYYWSER